jgi:hypothetical protein
MSLNRLEERNYQKKLNHIQKENRTNISYIDRNIKTITTEFQEQQRQFERMKYEQSLYQMNLDIDNLLKKKRRTKSAIVSYNENTDNQMDLNPLLKPLPPPVIRNQTAKYRSKTKQPILARRASTAHPALRESNQTNQISLNVQNHDLVNDESNSDTLFVRVKRVRTLALLSSSVTNILRKKPVTVSKSANINNNKDKLRQNSMPSFQNDKDVLVKFNEIFYNLI